jgi:AraC-like DNA-binding protein
MTPGLSPSLIRVAAIVPVRRFLVRSAAAVDRILERAHLSQRIFDHAEALIPQRVAARLLDEAASVAGVELLGAHIGRATALEQLGTFGRRIVQAATLDDALATAGRMASSYSGELFWVARSREEVRIWHRFPEVVGSQQRQLEQYSLLMMLQFLRGVAGPTWRPRAVFVPSGVPRAIADLDLLGESTVNFDQVGWAITISPALLRLPLPRTATHVVTPSELRAWTKSAPARDLPGAMCQLVETVLRDGDAEIDLVANWLGTSVRTLQRRLAAVGTSYADVLAKTRFETAVSRLADRSARLCDIAVEVGYADPAHFTRAFRRWTGSPPRAFRRLRVTGSDGARGIAATYARERSRWLGQSSA